MTKTELHGATLPEGWTAIRPRGFGDYLLIERVAPGTKHPGGFVTINMQRRIFDGGECFPVRHTPDGKGGPGEYMGRNWKKRLIEDACHWLEKTMIS